MSTEATEFDVLHVVRLRGVAPTEAIARSLAAPEAQVRAVIDVLLSGGFLLHRDGRRVSGYVMTETGKSRHADEVTKEAEGHREALAQVYERFLTVNGRIKSMCSDWQGIQDDSKRWQAIDELETFNETAQIIFKRAGAVIPRFDRYGRGLAEALDLLAEGDNRYFTSPLVESYHSVWFESHEDFLMCLGIDRASEGSF